jgi:hypothetical protein
MPREETAPRVYARKKRLICLAAFESEYGISTLKMCWGTEWIEGDLMALKAEISRKIKSTYISTDVLRMANEFTLKKVVYVCHSQPFLVHARGLVTSTCNERLQASDAGGCVREY